VVRVMLLFVVREGRQGVTGGGWLEWGHGSEAEGWKGLCTSWWWNVSKAWVSRGTTA
jgi:hypothetical protein